MQLREILDLDAMLTKDPAPESLSDDEDGDDNGAISEQTAGPSYKEEEDVEEESSRSAEHTSELQSLLRISYALSCSQKSSTRVPWSRRKAREWNSIASSVLHCTC